MSSKLGVQAERERRFRPMAIFLMMAFLLELIPASAFADPVAPQQQRVYSRQIDLSKCPKFDMQGRLLNPGLGLPNIPTSKNPLAWVGDSEKPEDRDKPESESHQPDESPKPTDESWFNNGKESPKPSFDDTEEPVKKDDDKPAVKRYPVRTPQAKTTPQSSPSPELHRKSDTPGASTNSRNDDEPSRSQSRGDSHSNSQTDSRQSESSSSGRSSGSSKSEDSKTEDNSGKNGKSAEDKDDKKKDDRCDDDHHHGSKDLGIVLAPASVMPEGQGIPRPATAWSRLTSHMGSYFEIKDTYLEAFANDYLVAHCANYENLQAPGKTEVIWDFTSPQVRHNKTSRNTYSSIKFTFTNCGAKSTDADAHYEVETKVWDARSPQGRKLKTLKGLRHLDSFKAFAGFNLVDVGAYKFKETRNGQVLSNQVLTISEPPKPELSWMRRTGGEYTPIYAPFAAQMTDEWLMRNKEYQFPAASSGHKVHKKIEWNWLAPTELKLNKTKKRSYLSAQFDYTGDGEHYRLVTTVYDKLHPSGRVYKVQEGSGDLAYTNLYYGSGLPGIGNYHLQEKINGVETELFELQGRFLAGSIQLPQDIDIDRGSVSLKARITTAPLGYIEKNFFYTITILDAVTGQVVRTINDRITENTENVVEFTPVWDGKDDNGQVLEASRQIKASFRVEIPHDLKTEFEALPNSARLKARQLRLGPQFELERIMPHPHGVQKSNNNPSMAGSGGDASGEGSSENLVAQTPPVREVITIAGPDPAFGVVHKGQMFVTINNTVSNSTGIVLPNRGYDAPLQLTLQPLQVLTNVYVAFTGGNLNGVPICGEFGPIWLYSSKGYYIYLGSQADYNNPCQPSFVVNNLQSFINKPNGVVSTTTSTGLLTRSALAVTPNSEVNVGGVSVQVASGRYDLTENDLAVRAAGIPIVISRSYFPTQADKYDLGRPMPVNTKFPNTNTAWTWEGRSQYGWVWNFQRHLVPEPSGEVIYRSAEGRDDVFVPNGASWRSSREGDLRTITLSGNVYTLTNKSGYNEKFKSAGNLGANVLPRAYLISEGDKFGTELTYLYDSISDPAGLRCYQIRSNRGPAVSIAYFSKDVTQSNQRFWSVDQISGGGKVIDYQYNYGPTDPYTSLLTEVVEPGRTVHYQYKSNFAESSILGQEAPPAWAVYSGTFLQGFQLGRQTSTLWVPYLTARSINTGIADFTLVPGYKSGPTAQSIADGTSTYGRAEAPGNSIQFTRTGSGTQVWQHQLNAKQQVTQITDPNRFVSKFEYDSKNNISQYTDKNGNLRNFFYDARNNLTSATDFKQNPISIHYNSFDKPDLITRPLESISLGYDPTTWALTSISENSEPPTSIGYNAFGAVTRVSQPNGQNWLQTFNLTHGALESRSALGGTWIYTNDAYGKLMSVQSPAPSNQFTEYTYDVRDRVTSVKDSGVVVSNTTYTPYDAVSTIQDAAARTTRIDYDNYQRPVRTTYPGGTFVNVTYDAFDRVTQMENANHLGQVVYSYDDNSRVTSIKYPGVATPESFIYDKNGLTKTVTKTDNTTVGYTYDPNRNVNNITYNGQNQVSYFYDSQNRVTSMNWNAGGQNLSETYTYVGSVLKFIFEPGGGTTAFDYDASHRRTRRVDPDGAVTNYTYTTRDELSTVYTDPVNSPSGAIPSFSMSYNYNPDGSLLDSTYSNGVKVTQGYDSRGHMTSKEYKKGATSLLKLGWAFNGKGQRTRRTFDWPGGSAFNDYTYTQLDELFTSKTYEGTPGNVPQKTDTTYTLDANHNRQKIVFKDVPNGGVADNIYTPNTADQTTRVVSTINYPAPLPSFVQTSNFGFSQSGSLNSKQFISTLNGDVQTALSGFQFDYKDQLTQVTANSSPISYTYDPSNRMKSKTVSGVTTRFIWDGDQIIKEYQGTTRTAWYLIGNDREAIYKNGSWHVLFTDDQGSQMGSADSNGNFENVRLYDDVGDALPRNGAAPYIQDDYQWQGARFDQHTGLHYMRNRYYSTRLGFIQRDPLRLDAGMNMHAFGSGDPINNTDPDGLTEVPGLRKRLLTALGEAFVRRGAPRAAAAKSAEWILYRQGGKELLAGAAGGPIGEAAAIADLTVLVMGVAGETALEAYHAGLSSASANYGAEWAKVKGVSGDRNLVEHAKGHAWEMGLEPDQYAQGAHEFFMKYKSKIKVDPLDDSKGVINRRVEGVNYRMWVHKQQGSWKIGSWYEPSR